MRADKLQDNYTTWGGGGVDGEERTIASTSQMRKLMGGVSKQKKRKEGFKKTGRSEACSSVASLDERDRVHVYQPPATCAEFCFFPPVTSDP